MCSQWISWIVFITLSFLVFAGLCWNCNERLRLIRDHRAMNVYCREWLSHPYTSHEGNHACICGAITWQCLWLMVMPLFGSELHTTRIQSELLAIVWFSMCFLLTSWTFVISTALKGSRWRGLWSITLSHSHKLAHSTWLLTHLTELSQPPPVHAAVFRWIRWTRRIVFFLRRVYVK